MAGGPAPVGAYYNQTMTPSSLLGLSPARGTTAAGHALPPTSHAGNDRGAIPWHPDSPTFWLAAFVALTLFGVTGASVRVRAFKGRAGANLGEA